MSKKNASSKDRSRETVAALILAAGGASRMGSSKALLPWRGTTLLGHCLEVARASACDEVYVVVGANGNAVERAVCETGVRVIRHDRWQEGMGRTIAAAIERLESHFGGVIILPCDQPFITPDLLDRLLKSRTTDSFEMAACRYRGSVGPPAVFPRSAFESLTSLSGDRGAKSILMANLERVALIDFPLGAFDIDTREDYDRALCELTRLEGSR